jgi:ElaB/YqjD/DUF883 family membrane-anchored ribosome-binding protein
MAQTQYQLSEKQNPPLVENKNLREIFTKENQKTKDNLSFTTADAERLEKQFIEQKIKRNNFSAKQKTWLWIGIGAGVGVAILILATRQRNDAEVRRDRGGCIAIFPPPPGCT